ncbi:MAG TPA: hypothetical protein VGW40_06795 [Allosphingosinicella sp.]|nr:hypothetical protein [Allosphingosinicella sp.]
MVTTACQAGRAADARPVLSVEMSDRLEDVQRRSSVELAVGDGPAGRLLVHVPHEFDFHFRYKGRELVIENVGGEDVFTSLVFSSEDGRLRGVGLNPRRGLLPLEEAIMVARELKAWFSRNGFVRNRCPTEAGPCGMASVTRSSMPIPYLIDDFETVERAWRDPSASVSEMVVFSLDGEGVGVALEMRNRGRMLGGDNPRTAESPADAGREYSLVLSIMSEHPARAVGHEPSQELR